MNTRSLINENVLKLGSRFNNFHVKSHSVMCYIDQNLTAHKIADTCLKLFFNTRIT